MWNRDYTIVVVRKELKRLRKKITRPAAADT